ncbi:i-AAA protease yme1 [Mucor velutinosus]|uniref:I-AAA protease yme1 n=1 Tax=Mucor velutinosus TaxID=708070 RepID=A0AAN7DC77_9FUNG|nr:i-AAA protease yme1 [Mucor velutinosus]
MPLIQRSSPPITAEDMMPTSAFEVSPILTASIFDEIYTSIVTDGDEEDEEEQQQNMPLAATMHQPLLPPSMQQQTRRRHTPLGRLSTNSRGSGIFELPPPSARWTRRLSAMQRINSEQDVGEEVDHIGPVLPADSSFPRPNATSFMYGQQCLNDRAYNTSPLLQQGQSTRVNMLAFEVLYDDGGQYGAMYGIENLLLNDGSVYCSGRKGTVNILAQYCGYIESGLAADKSCSISKIVIKAPQHGFTAPCRDGMIFISHKVINISDTSQFDKFTKDDYDQYIANKLHKNGMLEDTDPVAWFSLTNDRTNVIDLDFRSAKYVLVKMLRADYESDNIDMQYIGFIGHSGPRSFGSGKLC